MITQSESYQPSAISFHFELRGDAGDRALFGRRRRDQVRLLSLERSTRDSLKEFARVATAAHRVEEAIKRSKSQEGFSHYEVRDWRGWHHHQVLSLVATWFLVRESHRGKKYTPAITVPQIRDGIAMLLRAAYKCYTPTKIARNKTRR